MNTVNLQVLFCGSDYVRKDMGMPLAHISIDKEAPLRRGALQKREVERFNVHGFFL